MVDGGTESRPATREQGRRMRKEQEEESDRGTTEIGCGTHTVESGANQVVLVGDSSVFQTRVVK